MEVRLPPRQGDLEYATVQNWMKAVGDRVVEGEPIVEVDTDKVTEEIVAPATGTITVILFQEGDEVKADSVLAIIEEA